MGMLDGILDAVGLGTTGVPWGSIASGVLGFLGQEDTNESNQTIAANNSAFNAQQAQLNRDFQAEQIGGQQTYNADQARINRGFQQQSADTQMGFQERMSNTSYQRTINDLKAAGLNPMLAYSKGGASVPTGASAGGSAASAGHASGAQASAVQPAAMQNSAGAGVAAAQQAAQIDRTEAETDNIKAETELKKGELPKKKWEARTAELISDIKVYEQRAESARDNFSRQRAEIELEQLREEARRMKNEATLKGLDIPKAINEAAAEKSTFKREISPYLNDLGKVTNSASGARRALEPAPFRLRRKP